MSKKNQSTRLTNQHKESQGVVGIFGDEARLHDMTVGEISNYAIEHLKQKFPQLSFRYRQSILKKEINEALQKIDSQLGQTLFVPNSSIKPDGGIIEVKDDSGNWRIVLVSEAKRQGKDIENIKKEILVGRNKDQDLMAAGNAIERSHKNISEIANLMLSESHFPYILFLEGSNFLTETISITRPDGRVVTLNYNSGMLNRLDRLTAANYGMPINTNLCENEFVLHNKNTIMLQAASIYAQGKGEKWEAQEMLGIMIEIAKTSLKILGSDIFDQISNINNNVVKNKKKDKSLFTKKSKNPRKANHSLLKQAKTNKNDEFYTQLSDIESELQHYKSHFKNKVIFCNCDDPRVSNFFNYFSSNFKELGIKKLITACYRKKENNLFNTQEVKNGFFFEYLGEDSENKHSNLIEVTPFKGDGDFRNAESVELLKKSDIVVTNPPFSLFREFVAQLVKYNKKFLIIGNVNAITYKEIFKLIKENKVWLGINLGRGVSGFIVPEHYELYGTEARIDSSGNRIVSPNNCLWLTNLDTFKRHEDIVLTKKYLGNETEYPKYDNYNGINVNKTKDIPLDYEGFMGVPITFLHKFNPDQFEIIKFRKGDNKKDLSINGKCPYFRILIKNKRIQTEIVESSKNLSDANNLIV